jgi:hypothetical protein
VYNSSMQAKISDAKVARQVVDLAGLSVDTALVTLDAKSDEQKNYAGDVRLYAIAQMWSSDIEKEYQTSAMAKAVIAACNRHQDARFWLDNKDRQFVELLGDDIEAELGEE